MLRAPAQRPPAPLPASALALALPLGLVVLALWSLPPLAHAATPWKQITGIGGSEVITAEPSVARTSNGTLHVAWVADDPDAGDVLQHRSLSRNGLSASSPNEVRSAASLNNKLALISVPEGLRLFFGGLTDSVSNPLWGRLATATSTNGGTWTVSTTPVSNSTRVYVAAGISGIRVPGGEFWTGWGDSGPDFGRLHKGLTSATPDQQLGPTTCCDYNPTLAFDSATARVAVTWGRGSGPVQVQSLEPVGAARSVPNSQLRAAITGRRGAPGIYLAYPAGPDQFTGKIALWKFGAPAPKILAPEKGVRSTGIAPAPGGRLWVFWARQDRVYATRTNPEATRAGAIVSLGAPSSTEGVYHLTGDGGLGSLDLLAHVDRTTGNPTASWHRRVLPGVSLTASPTVVPGSSGGRVTFQADDAGDPLRGATVILTLGSRRVTGATDATGRAVLKVPAGTRAGRYSATATKGSYEAGATNVRVR